ncbi:heavy metal translocating P-type ATPase [Mycobacterium sp.]|uniref:heavy metal translocating P-type ATPase n=1 Tax=Mycobacterium sp. TaxID=1785 RepID=UPI002B834565|nr:heavy metal translocating P-type ATPase [Mycobacterium sp.]HTQ21728.1 heavy metal translocating P-type ATPase [Mycobacterium sp.]
MSSDVLDRDAVQIPGRPAAVRTRAFVLPEVRWAAAATVLFALGLAAQYGSAPALVWWALYLACYGAGGWEPALAGIQALRRRSLDVDLLMIVAAIGAAGIGQVLDGGLLIVIFATSGALEAFLTQRTADSVRSLLDLAPERATRMSADGEQIVNTASLTVGDVILVRPGERIGADGQVISGASDVDQASITGEPLPVVKQPGDEVFAGTLNGTGMLRVRVDRAATDTVVARIVAMVEEASATKAKAQLFIEKVEQYYSIGVVAATLAVFAIPLTLGAAIQPALLRAMTFMIVASPCAVVLATMPPLLAAMANAGRHGVLVKSAVVMEQLGSVSTVAFDKTGTLTRGTPTLTDVRPLTGTGLAADELLTLAAAAEHPSEHPLAAAVVAAARERGLTLPMIEAFESAPGCGVRAVVAGRRVTVGSPTQRQPLDTSPTRHHADAVVAELEADGKTAVVITIDSATVGVLGLEDHLRPDAAATVEKLIELTGTTPVLLTGDNPRAAGGLATRVAIDDVRASLLPQDKVAAVRDLAAEGSRVLLVGDGVNDAPALAAADTGIAMGRAGSDLALDTADAVVVRDELATIPKVIALSRRARRVVIANLVVAATFISVLVTWDLLGHLPLPLGVAGHEGSTVVVGLNGMRLLSRRVWQSL